MKRLLLAAAIVSTSFGLAGSLSRPHDHRCCRSHPQPAPAVVEPEAATARGPSRGRSSRRGERPDDDATRDLRAIARSVSDHYRLGEREEGDRIAASDPRIFAFDDANAPRLSATFRASAARRGGAIELCVWRQPGQVGPLAVAVSPGTYGSTASGAQDLSVLRAPVIVLPTDEAIAFASLPVACASFGSSSPRNGMSYDLQRFERGSDIDRLMVALCAGDDAPEPDAQLAVWITRNDLTRSELASKPRLITFGSGLRVGSANADGAASLLRLAGIDLDGRSFFHEPTLDFSRGRGGSPTAPQIEVAPAEQPAPIPETPGDPS